MIPSVNNITNNITNNIQTSSDQPIRTQQKAGISSSNLDSYQPTIVPTYNYDVYGLHYPKDQFEQNLSPDDLKYFSWSSDGTYRFPNVGAPPEKKQEWLNYSKQMCAEGFTPDDLLKMQIGQTSTSTIWFPPQNASVATKKAWLNSINSMSEDDVATLTNAICSSLAGSLSPVTSPNGGTNPAYWNQVSNGVAGISSYQDFFSTCLSNIQTWAKQIPGNTSKEGIVREENNFTTLINMFQKNNVK